MSALDDWIASQTAGTNTQPITSQIPESAWQQYLNDNPDVVAEYNKLSKNNLKNNYGITTPQQFAKWHYEHHGQGEGRPLQGVTPTTPTPTTPAPTTPTPTTPDPTGGNTNTTPTVPVQVTAAQARANAIAQQVALAKQEAIKRGVDYSKYEGGIQSTIDNIFGGIPQDVADYSGYVSPTLTGDIFSGLESQGRNTYGQTVKSSFSDAADKTWVPPTLLDQTINDLLSTNYNTANEGLQRGLKRGQLNDVGVNAGTTKLNTQKLGVDSKLHSTGNDVLQKYWDQLNGVETSASNAASGYKLGDNFDLSSYLGQAQGIGSNAKKYAPGDFLNLVGDDPLFNLSDLMGTAGQAQGAVNLQNLDVIDALNKKKQQDTQQRGLGSQGAF